LQGSVLTEADLSEADLRGAILQADLEGADLQGADLGGATLPDEASGGRSSRPSGKPAAPRELEPEGA
jgi:hypothetical protein